MAQIRITTELLKLEPNLIRVMKEYFGSVVELVPDVPHTRRYEICGRGVPEDETSISIKMESINGSSSITEWQSI